MTTLRKKIMGLTLAGTVVLWSLATGSMMNGNEVKAEVKK